MDYIIYKALNIINNKVYIGLSSLSLKKRKAKHKNDALNNNSQLAFHKAIRKYGFNNFQWEVIDTAKSLEEVREKEVYWISYYDSYNKKGYNMTLGGEGTKGCFEGENNPRSQIIVKLDLDGSLIEKFQCISNALESIGEHDISHIVKCCRGKINMAYGYRWMYEDDYEKYLKKEIKLKKVKQTKIVQVDMEGNFVKQFNSLKEGAESVNGNRCNIGRCCQGKQDSHKGFKWFYKEDYDSLLDIPLE